MFLTVLYVITVKCNVFLIIIIFYDHRLHVPKFMAVGNLALVDLVLSTSLVPGMIKTYLVLDNFVPFNLCLVQIMASAPSPSPHNRSRSEDENEDDPLDGMISRTGCAELHYALQDCMAEHQDWRKCQTEVQKFKECMTTYQNTRKEQLLKGTSATQSA
ncbi:unnamed protein product [Leuciscus chuanchicus]